MGFDASSDKPCAMPFSSNISSIASARPLFQTSLNQRRSNCLFSSDMRTPIQGQSKSLQDIWTKEPYTNFADGSSPFKQRPARFYHPIDGEHTWNHRQH